MGQSSPLLEKQRLLRGELTVDIHDIVDGVVLTLLDDLLEVGKLFFVHLTQLD